MRTQHDIMVRDVLTQTHQPSLSAALALTPYWTRNLTISVWPAQTALCSAVMPSSFGMLGSSTCRTDMWSAARHTIWFQPFYVFTVEMSHLIAALIYIYIYQTACVCKNNWVVSKCCDSHRRWLSEPGRTRLPETSPAAEPAGWTWPAFCGRSAPSRLYGGSTSYPAMKKPTERKKICL